MVTLFSQEKATEIHEYNLVKDAEDRGRKEGWKEGWDEGIAALVMAMRQYNGPHVKTTSKKICVNRMTQIMIPEHPEPEAMDG